MKAFGHQRIEHATNGEVARLVDSPARAVTREVLGSKFGPDSERRLIVSLEAGDLLSLRPLGTRRAYHITARDLFWHVLRCEAAAMNLAKAREAKERKAARLAAARQARAEKKLTR